MDFLRTISYNVRDSPKSRALGHDFLGFGAGLGWAGFELGLD